MRGMLSLMVICVFVLSACAASPAQPAPLEEQPTPEPLVEATPYPEPAAEPMGQATPYPLPGEPLNSSASAYPAPETGYEPQPGDAGLVRGVVQIEKADSGLVVTEGSPVQVDLHLAGSLPNPCHQLRVVMQTNVEQKRVDLEIYSVVDGNLACTEVIQALDVTLPLGKFSAGIYSVYINGELLGTFGAG